MPEINWDNPQKVKFLGEQTYIVQTTGEHNGRSFSGVVIQSNNDLLSEGDYTKLFNKEKFEPIKEIVTYYE